MSLLDIILKNPSEEWDWADISANPSITMKDVLDNPYKKWDWRWLSANPSITFQNVLDHPELPWNWAGLSRNPLITMKNVLDHPDKPWNWNVFLSQKLPITSIADIIKNIGFDWWNWYCLSKNPSITMKNVLDHPDKPWSWGGLSQNPSITFRDVLNHPEKDWDYDELSKKENGVFVKYNKKRVDLGLEEEEYFPSNEMIDEIEEKWLQHQ